MTAPSPESSPVEQRYKEYQDPHYHDADEVALPADDLDPARTAPRKKPVARKLPGSRRRFHDED